MPPLLPQLIFELSRGLIADLSKLNFPADA
jgi:hypothetical protein